MNRLIDDYNALILNFQSTRSTDIKAILQGVEDRPHGVGFRLVKDDYYTMICFNLSVYALHKI